MKPRQYYLDPSPMPGLTATQKEAGYVVFSSNYLSPLFPASIPTAEDVSRPLRISGTPGEYAPLSLGVRALRALGAVKVSAAELTGPGGTVERGAFQILYPETSVLEGQGRQGPWHAAPMEWADVLRAGPPDAIPAETTIQVWLVLHIPEDTPGGTYTGRITVAAQGGQPTLREIALEVWPFRLAEPTNMDFRVLSRDVADPEERDSNMRTLREYGMTAGWVATDLGSPMEMQAGRPRVLWDGKGKFESFVDSYKRAGFTRPLVWAMSGTNELGDVADWCLQFGGLDSAAFASAFLGVMGEIQHRARTRGWPEIFFQFANEPYEHRAAPRPVVQCAETLYPLTRKAMPDVKLSLNGANGGGPSEPVQTLFQYCDGLAFHDGPFVRRGVHDPARWEAFIREAERAGQTIWFYNPDNTGAHPEATRFSYGAGLWVCRPVRGVRLTDSFRRGGVVLALEGARQGIADYRYLLTFEEAIAQARESRNPRIQVMATQAEAELRSRLERIVFDGFTNKAVQGEWLGEKRVADNGDRFVSGPYKVRNGWEFSTYDEVRRLVAQWILRLQNARREP